MRLAPVGTPVSLRRSAAHASAGLAALLPGWTVGLYDSGTAALAVALQDARLRHRTAHPEAIVPAYGCPQLVSACLYAQVRPRIVDTAPGEWGYELPALHAALGSNTVAVLAVNLLGVGDQATQLLPLVHANGSRLIQDSAQHLPMNATPWCGDYVVLSFGRGKPLNLLRGGALAIRAGQSLVADAPGLSGMRARLKEALLGSRLAGLAFNILTQPDVYGVASRLPGLRVGATRFEPVEQITKLPPSTWRQVAPAYTTYAREPRELPWCPVLSQWQALGIRALTCNGAPAAAWAGRLRLALLAEDREARDRVVAELDRLGLGVSTFYAAALDGLAGIPAVVGEQGPFPNATALAERLLTLPTHRFVSADIVRRAHESLVRLLARGPVLQS